VNLLFVVTRNEAAMLRLNLAHHLAWGFDRVLVADNESTDATADVLRAFGDAVATTTVADPNRRHVAMRELLAQHEARHGPAAWVAVSDTDELWWGAGVDLRAHLARVPPSIAALNLEQKLFLPTALDAPDGPLPARRTWRTARHDTPLHTSYVRGKSFYRADWLRGRTLDDNHRTSAIAPERWGTFGDLFVHHYMIEDEDAFVAKVRSRLRWNPSLRPSLDEKRPLRDDEAARYRFRGFKRAWWDLYATRGEAGLRDYYRTQYVVSRDALARHLAAGEIVEDRAFADYARARLSDPA
jgi:hypothetical protein